MRHFCAAALLFGFAVSATAAEPERLDSVKKAAAQMGDAFMKNDYAKIVDSTYPKAIEALGGREKMIKLIEGQSKEMQASGVKFSSVKFEEPGPFESEGGNTFVVVPQVLELQLPKGKLLAKSYLLAISTDDGKTWKFLDGMGVDNKDVAEKVLPKLPAKLKLPAKQKPEFSETK